MTFAEDYAEYQSWMLSRMATPAAWEEHRALEKDAMFYRTNEDDITESLDILYWIREYVEHVGGADEINSREFGVELWSRIEDNVALFLDQ